MFLYNTSCAQVDEKEKNEFKNIKNVVDKLTNAKRVGETNVRICAIAFFFPKICSNALLNAFVIGEFLVLTTVYLYAGCASKYETRSGDQRVSDTESSSAYTLL